MSSWEGFRDLGGPQMGSGRALEPAGRALNRAGLASEPSRRALVPAGKVLAPVMWKRKQC